MTGRRTFRVMAENPRDPGKFVSVSGDYVQRASAFKRARRARAVTGREVRVWEYAGPGTSKLHEVPER